MYKKCQNVLQSDCTIFHSYEQCWSIPVALHPNQQLEWSAFFIIPILVGAKVASHCGFNLWIFLMTDDIENIFMCVLAIFISSFVKCLFNFLPMFIKLFSYCWLVIAFDILWKKNTPVSSMNLILLSLMVSLSNLKFSWSPIH